MIVFLQILGALAAVALGFYLGYAPYSQSQEEIEARMGTGKPRRAKRHFMWLNYFKTDERASTRGRTRQRFKTAAHRPRLSCHIVKSAASTVPSWLKSPDNGDGANDTRSVPVVYRFV